MSLTLSSLTRSARADEPACRREGDRVSCTADGFKKLTDLAVQAKADAKSCEVRLDASRAGGKTLEEARLRLPRAPFEPRSDVYSLFVPYLADERNDAWRSYLFLGTS